MRARPSRALASLAALALAACGVPDPSTQALVPMGDFSLGTSAVVAVDPQKGPFSRTVDEERFRAILEDEMERRFRRQDGSRIYHIGTSIEGYVVAAPGIPLVLSPKSILIVRVTVFEDRLGADGRPVRLNAEPQVITVLESLGAGLVVGSGYTQSPEEQMRGLSRNAARAIQQWMLRQPGWFGPDPAAAGVAGDDGVAAREAVPAAGGRAPRP